MITKTTWRPDTCGCVIVYEWDTEVPEDERTHALISIQKCVRHTAEDTDSVAYTKAKTDNETKNIVVSDIKETLDIDVNSLWAYDEAGVLCFDVSALPEDEKLEVYAALEKYGTAVKLSDTVDIDLLNPV